MWDWSVNVQDWNEDGWVKRAVTASFLSCFHICFLFEQYLPGCSFVGTLPWYFLHDRWNVFRCFCNISSELQDPCSSALVWMSTSGSEQVSSNAPLACFPEPVKAGCILKCLNKKCSEVETLNLWNPGSSQFLVTWQYMTNEYRKKH